MSETPGPQGDSRQARATSSGEPLIGRKYVYVGVAVLLVVLVIIVVLVVLAVRNPTHTQTFRDIAIIALAAESGLVGLALIVLIVQVARLTNMLEYEVKPILENTSDAVRTVRGTAAFMSEHMVSPVIRVSSYASGFGRLAGAVGRLFSSGGEVSPATSESESDAQSFEGGDQ
jgi:hypothetical protein